MDELILVRHAESEYNANGILNGDPTVPVHLSARGREQARLLGGRLAVVPLDLCVVSSFPRVRETAELTLAGRDVRVETVPELDESGFGDYDGGPADAYREWARAAGPEDVVPGSSGESRAQMAARWARAYRVLLARPERTILVVAHGLTVRYLLNAVAGEKPTPVLDDVPTAVPYHVGRADVERGVDWLERWCEAPSW
jgi:broad specificity phosphatase PhoE